VTDHLSGCQHILVQLDAVESPGFPGFGHNTARNDMQRVQLDAVNAGLHHLMQGFQCVGLPFTRQTDNQMSTDLKSAFACQLGGALIAGEIMAAVDAMQGFIVRGL